MFHLFFLCDISISLVYVMIWGYDVYFSPLDDIFFLVHLIFFFFSLWLTSYCVLLRRHLSTEYYGGYSSLEYAYTVYHCCQHNDATAAASFSRKSCWMLSTLLIYTCPMYLYLRIHYNDFQIIYYASIIHVCWAWFILLYELNIIGNCMHPDVGPFSFCYLPWIRYW